MNTASDSQHGRYWYNIGTVLLVWPTLAVMVGLSDWARDPTVVPVVLAVSVSLPPLLAWLVWRISPGVRDFVDSLDLRILVLLHSLRMIGFGFLFLYAFGLLHPLFAFPAAIGDAMAAFGALSLGIALFKGVPVPVRAVRRWNRFGLLDFVVAVAAGFLLRSNFLGSPEMHTDIMGSLPLLIFPAFLVPLMVIVHLAINAKLNRQHAEDEVMRFAPPAGLQIASA